MKKCKVCGKYFRLKSENRYEAIKIPVGFNMLTQDTITYECFDCPKCGCQNIVNIREGRKSNETDVIRSDS